jgi:hypothetical protein
VVLDTQGYVVRRCALERVPTTRAGGCRQAAAVRQRSGGGRGGEGRGNVGSKELCDDQLSGRMEGIVCSAGARRQGGSPWQASGNPARKRWTERSTGASMS